MNTGDRTTRVALRVGQRWFHADAASVRAIEAWQTLIPIPWPSPFLGLLLARGELVPVLDERSLDCAGGSALQRSRILICSIADTLVGVAAAEVAFDADDSRGGAAHAATEALEDALELLRAQL